MIKIITLKVTNFRSLYETSIDTIGDTNMFFGHNNSGKSNLFKFLELLFIKKHKVEKVQVEFENNAETKTETEVKVLQQETNFWTGYIYNTPFLFSNNNDTDITFQVELQIDNSILPDIDLLTKNSYLRETKKNSIIIKGKFIHVDTQTTQVALEEVVMNDKIIYRIEDEIEIYFENNKELNQGLLESILSNFNNIVYYIDADRAFTKELIGNTMSKVDSKNMKNWLFNLYINSNQHKKFLDLAEFIKTFEFTPNAKTALKADYLKLFPFEKNTDISFSHFGKELEVMFSNSENRLPLKNYGTGIQQFFYILVSIFRAKSPIIILEEIELNLSPILQVQLLKFLNSLIIKGDYNQLLFSSHSPTLTQQAHELIDVVHHITINDSRPGTVVESHDDHSSMVQDFPTTHSYFSYFYDLG